MLNFFVGKMLGTAQKCPQKYYGKAFTDINYKCTFFPGKIMEASFLKIFGNPRTIHGGD
jgi:hypothetical protein